MRRSNPAGRYTVSMALALLKEPPLSPPAGLGPYRRQDYEALPGEPRCELIFGRFYVSPSPSVVHQVIAALLYQHLYAIAKATGGRAFISPLDVTLADHSVIQPDTFYVSAQHREILRERIEGVPDLVIEVL